MHTLEKTNVGILGLVHAHFAVTTVLLMYLVIIFFSKIS